tara:strand:+ start:157 stop:405 length:249 start_codon:yes stop_codon:yes gene_type:complete
MLGTGQQDECTQFICEHCEKVIQSEKDYLIDDELRLCEACTDDLIEWSINTNTAMLITSYGSKVNLESDMLLHLKASGGIAC